MPGFYVRHNAYGNDADYHYPRYSVNQLRRGAAQQDQRGETFQGVSSKFILADGNGLYHDYGHNAANAARNASQHAANVSSSAALPRLCATRSLEYEYGSLPAGHRDHNGHLGMHHGGNGPAPRSYAAPAPQYSPAPQHTSYGPIPAHAQYQSQAPVQHSARPVTGNYGGASNYVATEVVPLKGARYPRTSIGAGHPAGPLSQVVERRYRGDTADLTPLLPCTYAPHEYVVNREDNDRYHRTSVYAASGLPLDMPAYASPAAWTERVQHARA